jgi:hypothetical protein
MSSELIGLQDIITVESGGITMMKNVTFETFIRNFISHESDENKEVLKDELEKQIQEYVIPEQKDDSLRQLDFLFGEQNKINIQELKAKWTELEEINNNQEQEPNEEMPEEQNENNVNEECSKENVIDDNIYNKEEQVEYEDKNEPQIPEQEQEDNVNIKNFRNESDNKQNFNFLKDDSKIIPSDLDALDGDIPSLSINKPLSGISNSIMNTKGIFSPNFPTLNTESIIRPKNSFTLGGKGNNENLISSANTKNISSKLNPNYMTSSLNEQNYQDKRKYQNKFGLSSQNDPMDVVLPINSRKRTILDFSTDSKPFSKNNPSSNYNTTSPLFNRTTQFFPKENKSNNFNYLNSTSYNSPDSDYFYDLYRNISSQNKNIEILNTKIHKVSNRPLNSRDVQKYPGSSNINTFSQSLNTKPVVYSNVLFKAGTPGLTEMNYDNKNRYTFDTNMFKEKKPQNQFQMLKTEITKENTNNPVYGFKSSNYNLKDPKEKQLYVENFKNELKKFSETKDKNRKQRETDDKFKELDEKLKILSSKKRTTNETNENKEFKVGNLVKEALENKKEDVEQKENEEDGTIIKKEVITTTTEKILHNDNPVSEGEVVEQIIEKKEIIIEQQVEVKEEIQRE